MIRGEKCNLRAVERSDARFLRDLLNTPTVQSGWGASGVPISIHRIEQEIEGWIEVERTTHCPAGLTVETLEGSALGVVLIQLSGPPQGSQATLSIAIEPLSQRLGFGRDALTSVIEALFDDWRVHRIEMACETDNEHATRLYQSLGFTLEGTRRAVTFTAGEWRDQQLFGLLATDPRPWLS
jgi:RimJ/RimL family protein N-acetyltransferase